VRVILSHCYPELYQAANEIGHVEQQERVNRDKPCGLVNHVMPTFDIDREEITAFEVDGNYLFKQYFDRDDVFDALDSYYNQDKYRFEVKECELNEVQQILDEYFYDLQIADELEEYCVVMDQDIDYNDVLRNTVLTKRRGDHVVFLMKYLLSVEQAEEMGAKRLSETDGNGELSNEE